MRIATAQSRQRIHVEGVVQGVGFRPFVYNLATRLDLTGFVGNDSNGVFIEVEGTSVQIDTFIHELQINPPPLAHINQISTTNLSPQSTSQFTIVESTKKDKDETTATALISPDLSICPDCLSELLDPTDRRYRYPFINCTNCGPRFTITKDIPYDRPLTTMADFSMCVACQAEYDEPKNRRFHAQPNACANCGPKVWFQQAVENKERVVDVDAIGATQHALCQGSIVAIKGIGGFHLTCDATSDEAVDKLRERKGRIDKPFAIMVANEEMARQIAIISDAEMAQLSSHVRPIVLLKKRADTPLSKLVAPGNKSIGVMLPYSPLHHLLFQPCNPSALQLCNFLILTSGNLSSEPIVVDNEDALKRLSSLVDAFLLHDRPIHVPCDDSVIRVIGQNFSGRVYPLRRSRGYAPFPVKLPFALKPTLAVGGELKSTFCLANGDHAFMSQHIGDMENLETLDAFEHATNHMQALFRITPEVVVHDLHPAYLSTRWVKKQWAKAKGHQKDSTLFPIQHHHAHIASVMAENGVELDKQVIGFAFDGTGYGSDGAIWGGEVLIAGYADFQRVAHLAYVPLPGGDAAIQKPYRMALAHLWAVGVEWTQDLPPVATCSSIEQTVINQQLVRGLNTVETSSMGRLFDAVAALAGVKQVVNYEGQAAIELESIADLSKSGCYAFEIPEQNATVDQPIQFNAAPIISAVVADLQSGLPPSLISIKFHRAVANLILQGARRVQHKTGLTTVALSGGVFQNVLLLELSIDLLEAHDFTVLTHRLVPANDGGLALGQAVIANCIYQQGITS